MIEVKTTRKGSAAKFLDRVRRALSATPESAVGFPAGKSGSAIVMRAVWNEFGTVHIPSRPFMRQGIKKYVNSGFDNDAAKAMKSVLNGGTPRMYLEKMSIRIVGVIQQSIRSGGWVANAPATIRAKGSSVPLIDTGEMRQSVTYEVR
jgi:hypothetical protein